jgi:hypothetical protein
MMEISKESSGSLIDVTVTHQSILRNGNSATSSRQLDDWW